MELNLATTRLRRSTDARSKKSMSNTKEEQVTKEFFMNLKPTTANVIVKVVDTIPKDAGIAK